MKKKIIIIMSMFLISSCMVKKPIQTEDYLKYNKNTFTYGKLIKMEDIFKNKKIKYAKEYLNTTKLGKNTINIKYTVDNINYVEKYTYEIIDDEKPIVWLSDVYEIEKGYEQDLSKDIVCADNYDKRPNCYIVGEYNVNSVGEYDLTFIAEDSNKNKEEISFTLKVIDPDLENNYIDYSDEILFTDVYKTFKTKKTSIGIDVSKYQGEIDWVKVKNAGVEFAMIRIGSQSYFNENYALDKYFKKNIEGAIKNDIKVGGYFYSYAINKDEAIEQANFVLDNISSYNIDMPIAFDWENFNHWNELNLSIVDIKSVANAFSKTIKNAGYTPIQYGSKKHFNSFWYPLKYDTWLAHYTEGTSDYKHDYKMWQMCNNGKVDGIENLVDIDIYYK